MDRTVLVIDEAGLLSLREKELSRGLSYGSTGVAIDEVENAMTSITIHDGEVLAVAENKADVLEAERDILKVIAHYDSVSAAQQLWIEGYRRVIREVM